MASRTLGSCVRLCILCFLSTLCASETYPKAYNLTWKSTNFKTILTWEPKPSAHSSYTVEYSVVGGDRQRNSLCTRSLNTECDLSKYLTDPKACYVADVISEPQRGMTSDLVEFPHASAPKFCPYKDTHISGPEFTLDVSKGKTILNVTDPLTAVFKDGRQLNIRDIFSNALQYRVTYWKNKSSGSRFRDFGTSLIEFTDLDKGESYCFTVQAYIPTRDHGKQFGEISRPQCSEDENWSIFKEYSMTVIIITIILILLLIIIIITVTVVCCKRRQKSEKMGMNVL